MGVRRVAMVTTPFSHWEKNKHTKQSDKEPVAPLRQMNQAGGDTTKKKALQGDMLDASIAAA